MATLLVLVATVSWVDDERLAAVLAAAGWSGRRRTGVRRYAVRGAAGHVDEVLDLLGAYEGRRFLSAAGRLLARAALRSHRAPCP